MEIICAAEKCTGCLACVNSCPADAIDIGADATGAIAPHIAAHKCIDCGLCAKICPANTPRPLRRAPHAYAAWSENEPKSSSGGVAAVMARQVVTNGGAVYGAVIENGKTRHIRVDTLEQLPRLRGSKYVQSDIGLAYRTAKQDLTDGRQVLFTGTPCQIAGLQAFLRKDYDNLLTVDLICHGTPSPDYLKQHLDSKTGGDWDAFSFRGEYDFCMTAYKDGKVVYQQPSEDDIYFDAFLKGLTYRDACYACPYSRLERVADITVGDFWGLDRQVLEQPYEGRISVVLPNTEKGQAFFETLQGQLVCEQRPLEEAASEQQDNLRHPSVPHPDRAAFVAAWRSVGGFPEAIKATSIPREIRKNRLRKTLPYRALRKVKKLLLRK